jgi:DNA-binding protein H-NS
MATAPDITKLSYAELQKLLAETNAALTNKKDEEIKVLVNGWKLKAEQAGFTVEEVIAEFTNYLPQRKARTTTSNAAPVVKYRDPATGDTWSGKGRTARWLQAHIDAGRKKEDFFVG